MLMGIISKMMLTTAAMAFNNIIGRSSRVLVSPLTHPIARNHKVCSSLLRREDVRLYHSPRKIRDSSSSEQEYIRSSKAKTDPKVIRYESRDEDYSYKVDKPKAREVRNHPKEEGSESNVFRSRRVFVQGLAEGTTWQELKDHFRQAGEVAFASISYNGKGHGIVQFETVDEAKNAIAIMRNFPLHQRTLYVRNDVQQQDASIPNTRSNSSSISNERRPERAEQPEWKCAHETDSIPSHTSVVSLIKARAQARKIRDYAKADTIRQQLLSQHSVHVDDSLKLYWNDSSKLTDIKGTGSWSNAQKKLLPWRQIQTTSQKDSLVHSNLIYALLRQRDEARQARLFDKADELLNRIVNAPTDNGATNPGTICKISDDFRTWKVWSVDPPQQKQSYPQDDDENDIVNQDVKRVCLNLVQKHQPDKLQEANDLLKKFEGREQYILEKLKRRFELLE